MGGVEFTIEDHCKCGEIVDGARDQFCWHTDCHRYLCSLCYNAVSHEDHRKYNAKLIEEAQIHELKIKMAEEGTFL